MDNGTTKEESMTTEPHNDRTERRVLRWNVPVNDSWHQIGAGQVLHVAVRSDRALVEVWTLEELRPDWPKSDVKAKRTVRVYGTGQPIMDADIEYLGSALVPGERLVWHVFGAPQ
jgi:hypothetical protein